MKKILLDCDNTLGMPRRPVDDAMAFYYLLGHGAKAELVGITSTFGNASAADAFECTKKMLEELGMPHMPQARGAEADQDPRTGAARLLVELSLAYAGELSVLAIGSLTNLYGAWLLDHGVYDRLNEVVLMGGITAPLEFHGQILDELNFSCSHQAACNVLGNARHPAVITGNNCLPVAYMPEEEFVLEMCTNGNPASRMIAEKCGYHFADKKMMYGASSTYCWDVVAAAFLMEPELFETETADIVIDAQNLHSGRIERAGSGPRNRIRFPKAKSREAFQQAVYHSWKNADIIKAP